jgi:hypothetical protein
VPRGDRVGWPSGGDLYLEPEAANAAVQTLAQEGGEPLAVSCSGSISNWRPGRRTARRS